MAADLEVGPAWCVHRDQRRVVGADHGRRLRVERHPQAHPVVDVGLEPGPDDAAGALGGEQEVDAEAAASLGDVDEGVDEARQFLGDGGELVDDDHEVG